MVGSFGPGQIFGELAMMYDCERQATVVASQASQLWALDRRTHAQITAAVAAEGDPASYVEMLQRVPLLQGLSHELLEQARCLPPLPRGLSRRARSGCLPARADGTRDAPRQLRGGRVHRPAG